MLGELILTGLAISTIITIRSFTDLVRNPILDSEIVEELVLARDIVVHVTMGFMLMVHTVEVSINLMKLIISKHIIVSDKYNVLENT